MEPGVVVETTGTFERPVDPQSLDGWHEYHKTATVRAVKMGTSFRVNTNEGVMEGQSGDYLCGPGVEGEYWPVAASIFEKSYEKVEED